jgi:hypothetical protein
MGRTDRGRTAMGRTAMGRTDSGRPAMQRSGMRRTEWGMGTGDDRDVAGHRSGEADAVLAELDRGRRDRWLIALTLVLAAVAIVSLSLLGPGVVDVGPVAIYGLLAAAAFYGVNVVREERRTRRITRDIIGEQERRADLLGQVSVLEALDLATQQVSAAEDLPEVVERILQAAQGLVGADAGAVLLRGAEGMTVAVAAGTEALGRGDVVSDDHIAAEVMSSGAAVRRGPTDGRAAGPVEVAAPLRLGDRVVGAVVLERAAGAPGFRAHEAVVLERFGAHAAQALRQTSHLDAHRRAGVSPGDAAGRAEVDAALQQLRAELDHLAAAATSQPPDRETVAAARAALDRLEHRWRELLEQAAPGD